MFLPLDETDTAVLHQFHRQSRLRGDHGDNRGSDGGLFESTRNQVDFCLWIDRKGGISTRRKEGVFQDGAQQIDGGRFITGRELFAYGDGDLM